MKGNRKPMKIELDKVRAFRLKNHHLDRKYSSDMLLEAAGVCGFQNSPPGAWEMAAYNRIENCSSEILRKELYEERSLIQAWSYRGVPVVFPAGESSTFLEALIPEEGEEPWIYTNGIRLGLAHMDMSFKALLSEVEKAVMYLDSHTVTSKERLDRTLSDLVFLQLPDEKKALWKEPSMYGRPDRQTVGDAIVSFLLRPCSHMSLVVFAERDGIHPTFTSYKRWTGKVPVSTVDPVKELMKKYLHCFGPSSVGEFAAWCGCTGKQARRMWKTIERETIQVEMDGRKRFLLCEDEQALFGAEPCPEEIHLLGAHDPYLDLRDRQVILEDKSLQRHVFQTIANPNVILRGGKIIGVWMAPVRNRKMTVSFSLWGSLAEKEKKRLKEMAEKYAAFNRASLKECKIK